MTFFAAWQKLMTCSGSYVARALWVYERSPNAGKLVAALTQRYPDAEIVVGLRSRIEQDARGLRPVPESR
ncbi:MAG: hypothetical protein FJX65_15570 [Alphaproteobacteria bacterium]|nr:hypothetical protein [Alphaproteobacteria bacterium]